MAATLAADAVIPVDAVDLAVVPAAGSGSSFFCAAVVETATDSLETTAVDVTMAADVVDLTTPACGSFSCCAAAADLVPTTVVADAITPVAVAIPADAKSESGTSSVPGLSDLLTALLLPENPGPGNACFPSAVHIF